MLKTKTVKLSRFMELTPTERTQCLFCPYLSEKGEDWICKQSGKNTHDIDECIEYKGGSI